MKFINFEGVWHKFKESHFMTFDDHKRTEDQAQNNDGFCCVSFSVDLSFRTVNGCSRVRVVCCHHVGVELMESTTTRKRASASA